MRSAFFAPAIAPSDSPAAKRVCSAALSIPIVFAIKASSAARSAFIGPIPLPGPSPPRTGAAAANAAFTASACACVIVPLATSAERTEAIASSGPLTFAIGLAIPFEEVRVVLTATTLVFDAA